MIFRIPTGEKENRDLPFLDRINKTSTGAGVFIDKYQLSKKELEILFLLHNYKPYKLVNQKEISEFLKCPLSTLNYNFKKLKEKDLISKNSTLTTRGKQAIQFFIHWDKTLCKKLRLHKIQLSVTLLQLPPNFFTIKHKILTPFTNGKYTALKGSILGSTLCFYSSKKLVIKIPDIFGNTDRELVCACMDYVEDLLKLLKLEYPKIKFGQYELAKFNSMHCAILNSVVAESFLLKKGGCYSNKEFCIDGSHKVPELEAENLNSVFENISFLVKYEDVVRENNKLKEINEKMRELIENQEDIINNKNYIISKNNDFASKWILDVHNVKEKSGYIKNFYS